MLDWKARDRRGIHAPEKEVRFRLLRIVHVITGLGMGGAEIMLDRLLGAFDGQRVESSVICLSGEGPIAPRIRERGVPLQVLDLPTGPKALAAYPRMLSLLRSARPDVVHTWMYHADFLGGTAARALGIPVIWALHATTMDAAKTSRATRWLIGALAKLSPYVPDRVVSCSNVGRAAHADMGYEKAKLSVIPNGFDTARFRKSDSLRAAARARWQVGADELVVGHVARFHPQKDHSTLLEAIARCAQSNAKLRFVFFGTDVTSQNTGLMSLARELGVTDRCLFLGPSTAVDSELPGFDVLVSSSRYGEAFPLVIGEAMASEVPCVVTDVGDSAYIVGDTGIAVSPANPAELATALLKLTGQDPSARHALGAAARARIEAEFSLARVAELYTRLYEEVAQERKARAS